MQRRLERTVLGAVCLLIWPSVLVAQQASVKRNVNLRSGPSTVSEAVELLRSGASVTVLTAKPRGGFYHVRAEDGQEGWVWSRNVTVTAAAPPTAEAPSPTGAAACDPTLASHLYNPERLVVKQKCISVTGTIADATNGKRPDGVRHEADGDTHGWLTVDPEFKHLLNAGNMSNEDGNLVFEIVCKFHVSQEDAKAACPQSYHSPVQVPPVGSHVRIVGTYVQDMNHAKWMEIHPVTSITVIP
jgi:hypothetical protein